MNEQQKKIVAGAKQYSDYITSQVPQRDANRNVKYYFSGSLAMLLLNSASSFKSSFLDKEGKQISEKQEIAIPDKNKELLSRGIRTIGYDVDVITTDSQIFAGKGSVYEMGKMREKCDLATELCPKWTGAGTMYFDWLADERAFEGYDVAELTMQDGTKVIVADPLSLAVHKFADGIKCKMSAERLASKGKLKPEKETELQAKYQKDIRDFTAMFNGLVALYPNVNFKQVVEHILETCPQTAFSGIMYEDSADKIKQFWRDAKGQIDEQYQNLFGEFIGAIGKQNKAILDKQAEQIATV